MRPPLRVWDPNPGLPQAQLPRLFFSLELNVQYLARWHRSWTLLRFL